MRIISRITDWATTPYTIYSIIRDSAISKAVKVRAVIGLAVILAYIISPVDIIPDVVPLSGWLDDLIIVPIGLILVRTMTPGIDIMEKRARAQAGIKRIIRWTLFSLASVTVLGLCWFGLSIYFIVKLVTS